MLILFQIIVGQPETFTFANLIDVGNRLINLLLGFSVGIAVIALLWSAYIYISSFGSEERAKQAKSIWYWTLIGLSVMMLAKVIIATGLRVIKPGPELREAIEQATKPTPTPTLTFPPPRNP